MHSTNVHPINRSTSVPQTDVNAHIRRVADTVHRLNEHIEAAVNAGVTIELMRASRCDNGCGQWGDQMAPIIRMSDTEDRWE